MLHAINTFACPLHISISLYKIVFKKYDWEMSLLLEDEQIICPSTGSNTLGNIQIPTVAPFREGVTTKSRLGALSH